MVKYTTEELLEAFKGVTLIELAEFKRAFEEEFDVATATPVAVAAAGAVGDGATVEEKDEFDVIPEDVSAKKIGVIRAVREIVSGLGLKGAEEMVESAPKTILEGVSEDDAEAAKAKLEEAGVKVSLK